MTDRRGISPVLLVVLFVVLAVAIGGVVWLVASSQPRDDASSGAQAQSVSSAQSGQAASSASDADSPVTQATTFSAMLAAGEVQSIRLVGDSITAGYGTDGYENPDFADGGNVIYDNGAGTVHYETSATAQSWANAFRAFAGEHGVASFVNAGINGAFMQELAENPNAWIGGGADVIVVALGTNDAGYYGPQEYRAAAEAGLAAAATKSRLVVALSPVADLRPASQLVEPAAGLGDVLRDVCDQYGYVFVDTRAAVTPEMFCDDGLHPNSQGSLAIWECLRATLGV